MPADDHLHPDQYRGIHQPDLEGPAIHEMEGLFGDDVYRNPHFYGHGDKTNDREASRALTQAKGRPDATVNIYRAAPHGVSGINTGDWVTTSPSYARGHALHADDPSQDWPVLSAQVKASHVRTGGNDIIEWGYTGPPIEQAKVHHPGGRRGGK